MTVRQLWGAVLVTVAYLLVELAFNARLLDVVGAAVSAEEIHRIEIYGRMLSSFAAGLLAWQILLGTRNRMVASGKASAARLMMVVAITAAAAGTYLGIQTFVDSKIDGTTAEFRRTSVFLALVQKAMVDGRVVIDGLAGGSEVFAKPEGKAFLGVFPLMAASVDDLESKVATAINQLVRDQVSSRLGGPAGYYDGYRKGVHKIAAKYEDYSKMPTPGQIEAIAHRKADEAWEEYVGDLAKRGWTPAKVPYFAQGRVIAKVRSKIDVPKDWNTWEEGVFRGAVIRKVRSSTPTSARFNGQTIPAGLSWASFFAHPVIQRELRDQMRLPAGIEVRPQYASGEQFRREIFNPAVSRLASLEIARFKAPVKTYEAGGANFQQGVTAAKAVILPPIALGCSMAGGITHAAKLVVLLVLLLVATLRPGKAVPIWAKLGIGVGIVTSAWLALSLMSNPVANSRLYAFLQKQVMASQPWYVSNGLHVVAVGQSLMYPVNEGIRTGILSGFDFGYSR